MVQVNGFSGQLNPFLFLVSQLVQLSSHVGVARSQSTELTCCQRSFLFWACSQMFLNMFTKWAWLSCGVAFLETDEWPKYRHSGWLTSNATIFDLPCEYILGFVPVSSSGPCLEGRVSTGEGVSFKERRGSFSWFGSEGRRLFGGRASGCCSLPGCLFFFPSHPHQFTLSSWQEKSKRIGMDRRSSEHTLRISQLDPVFNQNRNRQRT